MFGMKEYKCWCHVCGGHYVVKSDFMTGPTHVSSEGIDYQVRACNEHPREEIKKAYAHYQETGKSLTNYTEQRQAQLKSAMGGF